MRYLKIIENTQDIENLCKKYGIWNWTINNDGFFDVDGHVRMMNKELDKIPIKFGKVSGNFWCYNNELTSLEGGPKEVGCHFYCYSNHLLSLEGSPYEVLGRFSCYENRLRSLKGCPKKIGDYFDCSNNKLVIIDYLPLKIGNVIDFHSNLIRDIRVKNNSYVFGGICHLNDNPIEGEFKKWNGDLLGFIKNLNRLRKINDILEST